MADGPPANGPQLDRRRFIGVLGSVFGVSAAGCVSSPPADGAGTIPSGRIDSETERDDSSTPLPSQSPYTKVYRQTIDSVVGIRVFTDSGTSQGSGFVWDDEHVVTNHHVVANANEVDIRFDNGDWRTGEVVGSDVYSDLAAVRVENLPSYATPLKLVGEEPPIGTEVVALGTPFGFSQSVSAGIVSGVNRSLSGPNNFAIPDTVQTDAAVNPGNSGGPLVTLEGRVVGMVNAGGGDNVGFAISAALMKRVIPELIADGDYDHAYMGVQLMGVSPSIAEANGLEEVTGVLIVDVVSGGPSDGVLQGSPREERVNGRRVPVGGDVVVQMGDRSIGSQAELSTYLALETSPGDTISVEIIRDGQRQTVNLTLGRRPEP